VNRSGSAVVERAVGEWRQRPPLAGDICCRYWIINNSTKNKIF